MNMYNSESCGELNWLKPNNIIWTMTPAPGVNIAYHAFNILSDGKFSIYRNINYLYEIFPVGYLNENLKIIPDIRDNYGSIDNPFRLIL